MTWQHVAFALAGVIGAAVAVVHGILIQRHMVRPLLALAHADHGIRRTTQRLLPPLLHFSTAAWFSGGLALVIAAFYFERDVRIAIGALVGAAYLFGAIFNAWATHGRHPGWMLMAVAVGLIGFGLLGSDA